MATLTCKGYTGVLEVDLEAGELFGRTVGMRELITFQGTTVEEASASFRDSIDFYLDCRTREREPADRPYSGRFNVRIDPELHRRLVILAETAGVSLNEVAGKALATAAGEAPSAVTSGEPNWREVKARLEVTRTKHSDSQNGEPRNRRRKSTSRTIGHPVKSRS